MRRENVFVKTAQSTAIVVGGIASTAANNIYSSTERFLYNTANYNANPYAAGVATVALEVVKKVPDISQDLASASYYTFSAFGRIALAVFDGACSAYSKVSAQGQSNSENEFQINSHEDGWNDIQPIGQNDLIY